MRFILNERAEPAKYKSVQTRASCAEGRVDEHRAHCPGDRFHDGFCEYRIHSDPPISPRRISVGAITAWQQSADDFWPSLEPALLRQTAMPDFGQPQNFFS